MTIWAQHIIKPKDVNLSRGIHEDFSVVFHLVLIPDFVDVFPIKVVAAQHIEYIAEEPDLNV